MLTKVRVTHQGELVKITPRYKRIVFPHQYGRGDRQAITRFTKRSKRNLMDKFAIIDKDKAKNAVFITLTYSENFQDHKASYGHLRSFLRWLLDDHTTSFAVWKKEIQERGAIHYHIMAWNIPFIDKEKLAYQWSLIASQFSVKDYGGHSGVTMPAFTRIEYCKNRRKAWYYVSKYIGKIEADKEINPNDSEESGFNIGTNLHTGRWWGWVNRKNIPLSDEIVTEIDMTFEEYRRFRWDFAQVLPFTRDVHLAYTVKCYWFWDDLDPLQMLIAGIMGEMALGYKHRIE